MKLFPAIFGFGGIFLAGAAGIPGYIATAISDSARPPDQVEQDAWRQPAALIAFAGIKPGDKVADFMSGNGYFTRIFSPVVGQQGHVYAYLPTQQLANCAPDETAGTMAGYPAIIPKPAHLMARQQFADAFASRAVQASLLFKAWIGLYEALVDGPAAVIKQHLDDAEIFVDRVEESSMALLARTELCVDVLRRAAFRPRASECGQPAARLVSLLLYP